MKTIHILTALSVLFTASLLASPNLKKGEGAKKLAQMAGEKSPYYRASKEAFPKDYFMINQNLPFLVGVSLFHPQSDKLNLSKDQLDKLIDMKNKTVPAAAKIAKKIKKMELELAKAMIDEHQTPESQYALVEEISKLRTELTKAHLQCIYDIQEVLSKKQFKIVLELAKNKNNIQKKEKVVLNKNTTKGADLFKSKCASCHSLSRPKDMSSVVAPALNGVMRHLKMNYSQKDEAVTFIKDYVMNPSANKAICMPQKLKRFGLMPSQKGNVTLEELETIANWMFENYPQKGFKGMGR